MAQLNSNLSDLVNRELNSSKNIIENGFSDNKSFFEGRVNALNMVKELLEFEYYGKNIYDLTFAQALNYLHSNHKLAREGWNGKRMYIYLVPGSEVNQVDMRVDKDKLPNKEFITINPHIDMINASGEVVVGWLASQSDMLATDWYVVTDNKEDK